MGTFETNPTAMPPAKCELKKEVWRFCGAWDRGLEQEGEILGVGVVWGGEGTGMQRELDKMGFYALVSQEGTGEETHQPHGSPSL
jgi:hypothetical protein